MIETSIHSVEGIEASKINEHKSMGTWYTREITFTTVDGVVFTLQVFANKRSGVKIKNDK